MPLFEVVILEKPTKKEQEESSSLERIVFGPEPVIAADSQSAGIAAVLGNNGEIKVDRARMLVLVRPFS
jgi:hypothetical protein